MISFYKASLLMVLIGNAGVANGQVCFDDIERNTPNSHFKILDGREEVKDLSTGLIWKRCPEGLHGSNCDIGTEASYTWPEALLLSDGIWRLPNIKELSTIIETACNLPAINLTIFPNTGTSLKLSYLTNTPRETFGSAFTVDFTSGFYGSANSAVWYGGILESYPVRLVRNDR